MFHGKRRPESVFDKQAVRQAMFGARRRDEVVSDASGKRGGVAQFLGEPDKKGVKARNIDFIAPPGWAVEALGP